MEKIVDYRIVISKNAIFSETRAAFFLQKNIKLVCGKKIPIVDDTTVPEELEIVIGKTDREAVDGLCFNRHFNRLFEYVIEKHGDRMYLTGMGAAEEVEPPFRSYGTMKDGGVGTVHAVYKFVEDVLGYDFMSYAYRCYEENSDLEMPSDYSFKFTVEAKKKTETEFINGASVYSLGVSSNLQATSNSLIFKTNNGKIIVYDGGNADESEKLLNTLKAITGEDIPVVSAWLISHPHAGHVGAYIDICKNKALSDSLKVENVYCKFLPKEAYEFYRAKEADEDFERILCVTDPSNPLGAKINFVEAGDSFSVDEIKIEVLRVPTFDPQIKATVNDTSVVYKLDYNGEQSFMLAGDGDTFTNNDLMLLDDNKIASDILFVPHHGKTNLSPKLYERICAKAYIWQMPPCLWYGDRGDGMNSNGGLVKCRSLIYELGTKSENIHKVMYEDYSSKLPIDIF